MIEMYPSTGTRRKPQEPGLFLVGNGINRITVARAPRTNGAGLLIKGELRIPCVLGRGGISRFKREGDGATPAGLMHAREVLYRPDRVARPHTRLPVHALGRDEGWCDDPDDRNYNRRVTLPYPARHERLWRADHLYDVCVVLDWNMSPTVKGRGSAIFIHLERADRAPTEGCIALPVDAMDRLLGELRSDTVIQVG